MTELIKNRTKKLASDCWHRCSRFPLTIEYKAYCDQLIGCLNSVGANYRTAYKTKSDANFSYKVKITEDKADERRYFIELLLGIFNSEVEEMKGLHIVNVI